MVNRRRRGASLATVLAVVLLLTTLAATAVALYTTTLNFVQSDYNSALALSEAETALNELLFRLSQSETYGTLGTEEIRGRVTAASEAPDGQAYHLVTFRSGTGFAHSVNNLDGSRSAGALGRTVPPGMVHALATGFCRGRTVTIEALIEHPPFPFGLATSGKIHSRDPLVVKGTSSAETFRSGRDDRPGHVVANSAEGVVIERASDTPAELSTLITGFARSNGPIEIAPPSVVRGGIQPQYGVSDLPDVRLQDYLAMVESAPGVLKPGVVGIHAANLGSQTLNAIYFFRGNLRYNGSVEMQNAFLVVDGNLEVFGGVRGCGAIVCTGNVNLEGGTNLDGSNKVAVLAGQDLTVKGGGNYFQGILYSEGNLSASNVTVVGNSVVNSPDAARGNADLKQVTFVHDATAGDLSFTASSTSRVMGQYPGGPHPLDFGFDPSQGFPSETTGEQFSPGPTQSLETINTWVNDFVATSASMEGGIPINSNWESYGTNPEQQAIMNQAVNLAEMANRTNEILAELATLVDVEDDPTTPEDESEDHSAERAALQAEYNTLMATIESAKAELAQACYDYIQTHAQTNGSMSHSVEVRDITMNVEVDLNRYLPPSEVHRVSFYRLHRRKL